MKKLPLIMILLCFSLMGCMSAGLTADLLAYDAISLAALETSKGIKTLDAAISLDTSKREDSMLKDLKASILIAGGKEEDAQRIVVAMKTHIANYKEQEKRRAEVTSASLDNLAYIQEMCQKGKEFSLYRANIAEQWKAYLMATTKSIIKVSTGGESSGVIGVSAPPTTPSSTVGPTKEGGP